MRYFLTIFLLSFFYAISLAQPPEKPLSSTFGGVHSPSGNLHVLMIFVRFEGERHMNASRSWPDVSETDKLPLMAQGASNQLLHTSEEAFLLPDRTKNLSDYYYTMSDSRFRLTGDIFPIQVPVAYVPENSRNFFRRQEQMNQAAINWIAAEYPDFDWSRYDRRTNAPKYQSDNSTSPPDGILDYVVFMYRDKGSTGMGSSGNVSIPNSSYKIRHGHTGIKSYPDAKHNWEYFKHEFAHNLYDCPHYLGANSADGTRFYTQKGWGMMAAWHAPFFTANAWESWWLGWLDPQLVEANGRYQVRDFLTGRDAIRIPLPGTSDVLWLENHQKKDLWDDKIFYNDQSKDQPQSAPGLYAYVVASPGADRNQPRLNPFSPAHANLIKVLNGEGNFDYETRDSMRTEYGSLFPVFEKVQNNPISGQNDFQFIRYDVNGDGRIGINMKHGNKDGGGKREEMDVWFEQVGGEARYSLNCTGDEQDAFQVGDVIALDGLVPALNYPNFDRKTQILEPYVLNGIRIEVSAQLPDGTFVLDIQLNHWAWTGENRWCGNMVLSSPEQAEGGNDIQEAQLARGASLTLDLSHTPNRETAHPTTGTYLTPTRLVIEPGRRFRLSKNSSLSLIEHSELVVQRGAILEIDPKASLQLRRNGQLTLEAGSTLILHNKSQLEVGEDSQLTSSEGAIILIEKNAKFIGGKAKAFAASIQSNTR